ncbi:MAG: MEDS domain-containing protein [candidate division Zixibacteria bacterium]|nr:MEDS domain-containing protein [candidate division Zixibacteria bacterium]
MKKKTKEQIRKSGIDIIGDAPWGTHLCQFYQTKEDLVDILVPYFKAGLRNNEFCMWVTSEPLDVKHAKAELKKAVKDLDKYIKKGQIEILDYSQWYTKSGRFSADRVLEGWVRKENQAIRKGFDGLRLTGNTFWLEKKDWESFTNYEAMVNSVIRKHRMFAICSYYLDKCKASEVIDVVSNHQFALIKHNSKWKLIEASECKKAEGALRESEGKYKTLVEHIPQKIFMKDRNSVYISCNENYARDLKIRPDEIAGKTDFDFHPKNLAEKYRKDDNRIIESGKTEDIEERYIQDGQEGWVRTVKTPIKNEKGDIVGVLGIFRDITERKKAKEELRESESKLREQKLALEQKNVALSEMIEQIGIGKDKLKEDILTNINEVIFPILERLELKEATRKQAVLLESHLKEITSSFGRKITKKSLRLSPREIDVCSMVKGRLTSKEIADLLDISYQTIEKHRKIIRRKLDLANKNVNLTSFLRTI